jgi:hypothetical protein
MIVDKFVDMIKDFGFEYDIMGSDFIVIKSRYDIWLVKSGSVYNSITKNKKIRLYHLDKYGKCGKHYQTTVNDIHHLLAYIKQHDKKYIKWRT